MVLTVADQVWNRAALQDDRSTFRAGDHALADMLQAHNLAMNGGMHHSAEVLARGEWEAAEAGYRYFGFDDVIALLGRVRQQTDRGEVRDEDEVAANEEYSRLVPDDDSLVARFEAIFVSRPSEFAPIGDE